MPEQPLSPAAIALNRFGLGARPGDAAPENPSDAKAWLRAQFDRYDPLPPALASLGDPQQHVTSAIEALRDLRMAGGKNKQEPDKQETQEAQKDNRRAVQQAARSFYQDAVTARVHAAVATDTPFVERLVHFWSNHFAVSMDKGAAIPFIPVFEATAIRPHVLGRFEDMLLAVEKHPAMLLYLDQAQSAGPNSTAAQIAERRALGKGAKRSPGLNENLAREILELHTLGARSGYTQEDVTEFARALTGWSVDLGQRAAPPLPRFGRRLGRGGDARVTNADEDQPTADGFVFRAQIHEPGTRTILNRKYQQNGEGQAHAILHDLATSPATARHLATKLAIHFAGDNPPPALVDRLTAAYQKSNGDLPTLYRVLIDSPECWTETPVKFKNPWEWIISALRATGVERLGQRSNAKQETMQFAPLLQQLGQPVWRPGSPAGWDDVAATWAAPDGLLRRVELAQRFATATRSDTDPKQLAQRVLPGSVGMPTQLAINSAESRATAIALLLVSPEFQRR